MIWNNTKVLVTGGCSFIGSHIVEALVGRSARVRVVDNLSSGKRANIGSLIDDGRVEFHYGNLLDPGVANDAAAGIEHVFHLAADHGGRGYIAENQAACATNLALDGLMIRAAHRAGVEHFTYASSGCVYPTTLQQDPNETVYLHESAVGPPYQSDEMYGWAKFTIYSMTAANLSQIPA